MKTFLYILMTMVLVVTASGCGSDKERGKEGPNKRQDLPRAVPTEQNK